MSLLKLLKESPEQIEGKLLQQIIAFAGDGKLRDDQSTSLELRVFLSEVESEHLHEYANECLNSSFKDSGLALQDTVNEVGRRLGLEVENGRYRGSRKHIGFDGLWAFPNRHSVVVEVKTTDAYRIDTATIAGYRKKLIARGRLAEESSSTLIVVGRQETGDLEAQIRGSRFAWDTRIISVSALIRLMVLRERLDDPNIIEHICQILIPREFTRLDGIVDLVFFATEEANVVDTPDEALVEAEATTQRGKKPGPAAFHSACVARYSKARGLTFIKRTRSSYSTPDKEHVVVCAVSKSHERQGQTSYWFAFHPTQKSILEKAKRGFLILGCGSETNLVVIPFEILLPWLEDFWTTERENRFYWHVRIQADGSRLLLDRKKGLGRIDISEFKLGNTDGI